jgi:radical SAM superfamily
LEEKMKEKVYIPIEIDSIKNNDEIIKKMENNVHAKKILQIKNKDFTSINIEKQKEILTELNKLIKEYKIFGIKITSDPDSIDKNNLKLLKKYKVKEIELNIESSNDYILKNMGADYDFETIKKVANIIKHYWISVSAKITIGLPESTLVDDLNTIKKVMKLKPMEISLIPCNLDYNRNVKNLYEKEEFIPLSKVQLVERIKEIIELLKLYKVERISIGEDKQYIEEMPISQFRRLVATEVWYEKIIEMIKSYNVKVKEVDIEVNKEDADDVKGLNNKNLEQLEEVYDVKLNVIVNNKMKRFDYKMKILKTYTDFLEENDN